MNTVVWGALVLGIVAYGVGAAMYGYHTGKADAYNRGYERGRVDAEHWWLEQGALVDQEREQGWRRELQR